MDEKNTYGSQRRMPEEHDKSPTSDVGSGLSGVSRWRTQMQKEKEEAKDGRGTLGDDPQRATSDAGSASSAHSSVAEWRKMMAKAKEAEAAKHSAQDDTKHAGVTPAKSSVGSDFSAATSTAAYWRDIMEKQKNETGRREKSSYLADGPVVTTSHESSVSSISASGENELQRGNPSHCAETNHSHEPQAERLGVVPAMADGAASARMGGPDTAVPKASSRIPAVPQILISSSASPRTNRPHFSSLLGRPSKAAGNQGQHHIPPASAQLLRGEPDQPQRHAQDQVKSQLVSQGRGEAGLEGQKGASLSDKAPKTGPQAVDSCSHVSPVLSEAPMANTTDAGCDSSDRGRQPLEHQKNQAKVQGLPQDRLTSASRRKDTKGAEELASPSNVTAPVGHEPSRGSPLPSIKDRKLSPKETERKLSAENSQHPRVIRDADDIQTISMPETVPLREATTAPNFPVRVVDAVLYACSCCFSIAWFFVRVFFTLLTFQPMIAALVAIAIPGYIFMGPAVARVGTSICQKVPIIPGCSTSPDTQKPRNLYPIVTPTFSVVDSAIISGIVNDILHQVQHQHKHLKPEERPLKPEDEDSLRAWLAKVQVQLATANRATQGFARDLVDLQTDMVALLSAMDIAPVSSVPRKPGWLGQLLPWVSENTADRLLANRVDIVNSILKEALASIENLQRVLEAEELKAISDDRPMTILSPLRDGLDRAWDKLENGKEARDSAKTKARRDPSNKEAKEELKVYEEQLRVLSRETREARVASSTAGLLKAGLEVAKYTLASVSAHINASPDKKGGSSYYEGVLNLIKNAAKLKVDLNQVHHRDGGGPAYFEEKLRVVALGYLNIVAGAFAG